MTILRLVQAATDTAHAADRLGQRFAAELAAVLRAIERRLGPLVDEAAAGSRTSLIKAAQANRTRKALAVILAESGYPDLAASAYGDRLDTIVARVLDSRRLAQSTAKLSGAFDQRVAAIKFLHETDLLDAGDVLAHALWQAVTRGLFSARPVDRILADLYGVIDASEADINTLYDTSVSIVGRQVEALQAGDDPETPFLYAGPADTKTRPFCRFRVGKVFTRAAIDAMDNRQIGNVFLTGGGYNCRHTFLEVSKFSELKDYVGTEQRVPEIAAQLERAA